MEFLLTFNYIMFAFILHFLLTLFLIYWPYNFFLMKGMPSTRKELKYVDTDPSYIAIHKRLNEYIKKYGDFEVKILDNEGYYAFVFGDKPQIYITKGLVDTFDIKDYEYYLVHEVGHLLQKHGSAKTKVIYAGVLLNFIISSAWILLFPSLFLYVFTLFYGILYTYLVVIPTFKKHEDQADIFALQHLGLEKLLQNLEKMKSTINPKYNWVRPFTFHRSIDNRMEFLKQHSI